VSSIILL